MAVTLACGIMACQGILSGNSRSGGDPRTPSDCSTPSYYFRTEVWPKVVEGRCTACHIEGGAAAESAFILVSALEDEEYLETNFSRAAALAETKLPEHDNRSLLELKPTGSIEHGGDVVIPAGSSQHEVLEEFISRVDGVPCDAEDLPPLTSPFYEGLTFIEPVDLLRRASLSLAGRLPQGFETGEVEAGGLAALEPVLDSLMTEEAFLERIKEGFSDIFLTAGYDDVGETVLPYSHFRNRLWYNSLPDGDEKRQIVDDYRYTIRREPVELIAYIVRENRPFTEILTGDYMVVSPYTARGYGIYDQVSSQFNDANDPFEFVPTQLPALINRRDQQQPTETGRYPHAGVLSTFHYTHRYPTTLTNRNRHRARMFYQHFLGVDVMALAPAVTDAAAATAGFANPTMEAPECVACHQIIDPIAGLFQGFEEDATFTIPAEDWYTDMFGPGYEQTALPEAEKWRAMQWLGEHAAADARFPIAMAEHVFYMLTQEKPLRPPQDTEDPMFGSHRRAYDAQREMIQEAARQFVDDDHNLKTLFKWMILSPYYRADDVETEVTDTRRLTELEVLGLGALLTPEQLGRKIKAIFDVDMGSLRPGNDQYMLYGGIDYRDVTERAAEPSGVMGAMMRIMSGEIACEIVPTDLTTDRELFPHVDRTTSSEAAVRDNIAFLHQLVLGQRIDASSAEVDRTYALFSDVVAAGAQRVADGAEPGSVVYSCRPPGDREDPAYLIRGWQAVVSYLIRRPEFLSQ